MTDHNGLDSLRIIGKRVARTRRIAHHQGLDIVAVKLGYPHWKALALAGKDGWQPTTADLIAAQSLVDRVVPDQPDGDGTIDGHAYSVAGELDAVVQGKGWAIIVDEAPSRRPRVEVYGSDGDNPILNPDFKAKALEVANRAAEALRGRIASDWPRRSTKPDAEGRTVHPLWQSSEPSKEWHCLHCDGVLTGAEMAGNMWHCPKCDATPIDIFPTPFWRSDD